MLRSRDSMATALVNNWTTPQESYYGNVTGAGMKGEGLVLYCIGPTDIRMLLAPTQVRDWITQSYGGFFAWESWVSERISPRKYNVVRLQVAESTQS